MLPAVPWASLVSPTGDERHGMKGRTRREIKAVGREMSITFSILSGFHFYFFNPVLGDEKHGSRIGQKGPYGCECQGQVTHKPWRHRQIYAEAKQGKIDKNTLNMLVRSLAVPCFTAEGFEVLHFLGVLHEQQS